jgi:hypothetical protein
VNEPPIKVSDSGEVKLSLYRCFEVICIIRKVFMASPEPAIVREESEITLTEARTANLRGELPALIAALNHAQTMANQASEVRMRNFNFFVAITGALIAGYAKLPAAWSPVLGLVGMLTSVLFFGLDVRGRGLLKRSIDQLVLLEPLVWERAAVRGWSPIPRDGGSRFLSHNWIYKTFFVIVGAACIVVSALRYAWR